MEMLKFTDKGVPRVEINELCEMIHGFRKTEVLLQCLKLDIFTIIRNKGDSICVQELADSLKLSACQLERLLNACTSLGLLSRYGNDTHVFYNNSEVSMKFLTSQSEHNILAYVNHIARSKIDDQKLLENALQSQDPDISPQTTGFYNQIKKSPHDEYEFHSAMESIAKTADSIFEQIEFGSYKHIVDLGGGLGTMAMLIKSKHPRATVTLAETPEVIEKAKRKGLGINYIVSDFFNSNTLPKADLYVMAHILHNWNDDKCRVILKNVYNSLLSNGSILLLDKHMQPNKDGPILTSMRDINMMIHLGEGKERTESEFRLLLGSCGFEVCNVYRSKFCPLYDGMLAVKRN